MSANHANRRIAAFFDLDGTLLPLPSLERRFVATLRYHRAIPATNYIRWLAQAIRTAPQGITRMAHANKMYLHNVCATGSTETLVSPAAGHAAAASVNANSARMPPYFPAAINRVAWHATQGHNIILVTGTLEPLAKQAALALTLVLIARGITALIGVCATRLEQTQGHWTGRIDGEPIFAEAKATAIRRIALQGGFDLARCYGYGDASDDRWLLGAVGRPTAVNPSRELKCIAELQNWPIVHWKETRTQQIPAPPTIKQGSKLDCTAIQNTKSESLV
jgi:HAD superfamily hydrolase (TIGR01490 family)